MFGLSIPELLVIFAVALIVFGPEKLPVLASQFGKIMAELRRNSDALRREFYNSVYTPANDVQRDLQRELRAVRDELTKSVSSAEGLAPAGTEPNQVSQSQSPTSTVPGSKEPPSDG